MRDDLEPESYAKPSDEAKRKGGDGGGAYAEIPDQEAAPGGVMPRDRSGSLQEGEADEVGAEPKPKPLPLPKPPWQHEGHRRGRALLPQPVERRSRAPPLFGGW